MDARFCHLLPPLDQIVKTWIEEDLPSSDIGGYVVGEKEVEANLYCKSAATYNRVVIAGVPFLDAVFKYFGLEVLWMVDDGVEVDTTTNPKVKVATVRGKCRNVLMAERTALNIFSRASGVATASRKIRDVAVAKGWKGEIAGASDA